MLAAALAYLGPKIISLLTEDRNEWRAHAKELTEALRLNTQTLAKVTDVVDQARAGDAELAREVRQAQEKTLALQERTLALIEALDGSYRASSRGASP